MTIENISVADTAKLVRKALKRSFPDTKLSVRSKRYAGGGAVYVEWTDGPLKQEVSPVVEVYEGAGFDVSTDLKYHRTHWLRPDGAALVRFDPGASEGSMGMALSNDNRDLAPVIPGDAKVVQFQADFIVCTRQISSRDEKIEERQHGSQSN